MTSNRDNVVKDDARTFTYHRYLKSNKIIFMEKKIYFYKTLKIFEIL